MPGSDSLQFEEHSITAYISVRKLTAEREFQCAEIQSYACYIALAATQRPPHVRRMFDSYLKSWCLVADVEPIVTRAARLQPVTRHGEPAMLKLSFEEDERLGSAVMEWWDGDGAARVLAREEHALLLE